MTSTAWATIVAVSSGLLLLQDARAQDSAPRSPTPSAIKGSLRVETVARGLVFPWGLEFLPDGRMLVTERPGRLRIVEKDGRLSPPLSGVPQVFARGQGGLLDVALDPEFASNRIIYLSYAEPGEGRAYANASLPPAGIAVARARLGDNGLSDVRVIYRQHPKTFGGHMFGSRLVFRGDGTLLITLGDRYMALKQAQDLSSGIGKIARIHTDGSIPRDNPFLNRAGARPEIWSYGHRNPQAAAIDPETGQLWIAEHGPVGGDELNHPEAGKNYGWPVIGYGHHYDGQSIGGTAKEGMEQPVYYWDPVIAPSGMLFYTGSRFRGWKGSVLIGSMNPGALVRLEIRNGKVVREFRYTDPLLTRVRDVRQGPDGLIYLITDSPDGKILRALPR